MLRNVSYNDAKIDREIADLVGPSYSFMQRIRMGGNGSARMLILSASADFHELLTLDNKSNYCYMEFRPMGLIIRFRSLLETHAFVIPYFRLVLYHNGGQISFHSGEKNLKVRLVQNAKERTTALLQKIMNEKNRCFPPCDLSWP